MDLVNSVAVRALHYPTFRIQKRRDGRNGERISLASSLIRLDAGVVVVSTLSPVILPLRRYPISFGLLPHGRNYPLLQLSYWSRGYMRKMQASPQVVNTVLVGDKDRILSDWLTSLTKEWTGDLRMESDELKQEATKFVDLLSNSLNSESSFDINSVAWRPTLDFLEELSRSRAVQGFTADQTATFVFSLKRPLFAAIRRQSNSDATSVAEQTWNASELLDKLGIHTFNAYLSGREQIIRRQQEELLELSTPVVKIWDGVLALPMIGTLDSARTQVVMETLLQRIVETGAELAIIDITGVPTVDTLVAQHLLKTITAIRLMGAECIVSGIRPQIAQTIVHLGVDLQGVTTKASLADALSLAFKRIGVTVSKAKP